MRILRGKSSLEVSSQGFALFVVGLVLATFLGGAVRTILSSDRVHTRIVNELKSRFPRNEFQIGRTEVLLSRGLWPGLGLRLRDVSFKQDVCGKLSFTLDVPQMTLPVDLFSLRHGRVRLGTVSLDDGKMHLDYRDCPPKTADQPVVPSQGIRSAVAEKGIKPPQLDWREVSHAVGGLELTNFRITYERNITWRLGIKYAELEFDDEMNLEARIDVQKQLTSGELTHGIDLKAHGEKENLNFSVLSEFKEGILRWTGSWDLAHNVADTKVLLTQIPLKDLSSELFQMGFAPQEIKLKTAWLTCQAAWQGDIDQFDATPVKMKACRLEGAYGRVDLEQADWFVRGEVPFKESAQFHVQKLQMLPLIESLGRQVLPAVLARLGVWTGVVEFGGPQKWKIDGLLENAEIIFSNQSVRGKQVVRSMRTQAARTGTEIDGKIDEVALEGGEFAGHLAFRMTGEANTGEFDVAIDRLGFSPSIQNVLVGGPIAPIRLFGKGELASGELRAWNGLFTSQDVRGEGWHGNDVEVKSKFIPGSFQIEARAARATIDSRFRNYPQLRVVRANLGEAINWKDVNAKLEVLRTGGTLSSLTAIEEGGPSWRLRGGWLRDGLFSATLMAGTHAYAVRGEKGGLIIHDKQPGDSP